MEVRTNTILGGPEVAYRVADLVVDVGRARVTRAGTDIPLPKLSFDLLLALIEAAPRIVSLDGLMDRVWAGVVVSPETVSQRVKLLRDALGDDSKEPRYIAAVRSRGYRLVAEVSPLPAATGAEPSTAPVIEPTGDAGMPAIVAAATPHRSRARDWRMGLVAACVVALTALAFVVARRATHEPPDAATGSRQSEVAAARSVAVLPFESIGAAQDGDVLALGIAEAVLHQLASLREVVVIARTSSFAFRGRMEDVRDIGRQLNARYLLEGSVQQAGGRLRVTAQLIDAITGAHVWSMRFDRSREDVFAVQDEIALQVAKAMELSLDASATDRLAGQGTRNLDAYLAYLQGRANLGTGRVTEVKQAIERFAAAIKVDPSFAAAYVSLAEAEIFVAEFEVTEDRAARFESARRRAAELLRKALALDPDDGPAYLERGHLEAFSDLAAAEASYRRGLALRPSDARGYAGLAAVLFEDPARRNEALAMLDRARRLDPLEPAHDVYRAVFLLYERGDVVGADTLLRNVLQRQPSYLPALTRLGEIAWCCEARPSEAIRYLEQAMGLDPLGNAARSTLLRAYLDVGDLAAARSVAASSPQGPGVLAMPLLVYQRDWIRAGNAAYEAVANQTLPPTDEFVAVLAIRQHARTTGDYARAIAALESLSGVAWDQQGNPVLPERADTKASAVGLADLLQASGQRERARRLLRAIVARMDRELAAGSRGELWYCQSRLTVLALSADTEGALAWLQRGVTAQACQFAGWSMLTMDPALRGLQQDRRFQASLQTLRDQAAAERVQLDKLRADGLVPKRG